MQDIVTYRAQLFVPETTAKEADDKPAPLPGSLVAFAVNGTSQGVAYRLISRRLQRVAISLPSRSQAQLHACLAQEAGLHSSFLRVQTVEKCP